MANTSYCNGSTKLFDIKTDPHELRNLAEDPEFADELDRLRTEYERWSGDIVDHGLVSEQVYLESIWPDQVQPTTSPPWAERDGDRLHLSCDTPGASIGFQILKQGETPAASWNVYVEPVAVRGDETLVAVAHRIGYRPSEPVSVEGNVSK